MEKALFKKDEQIIPIEMEVQFTFNHTNYRMQLALEIIATLASIPCGKCGKTSRDIIHEAGGEISDDDLEVDVLNIIHGLPEDENRSILEADYVFIIKSVDSPADKIENVDAMIGVQSSREARELTAHVKKCLVNAIICDGCCFTSDYIETLINA